MMVEWMSLTEVVSLALLAEVWQSRDESKNLSQRHEVELIKEEKRKEVEAEIRVQVDWNTNFSEAPLPHTTCLLSSCFASPQRQQ